MVQALLKISGKVQGVWYRASAKETADKLSLRGYAVNLPDKSVEVLLQGEKEKIEEFIKWAAKGPPGAEVAGVKIEWQECSAENRARRQSFTEKTSKRKCP